MNRFHTGQEWFDNLIPEGMPTHTSTLVTGPGGSGKPLIGNLITAAWLRQGGSVVFMSLQYPSHKFIVYGLKKVAGLDLEQYQDRVFFVELDANREDVAFTEDNRCKSNLVIPKNWDTTLEKACSSVPDEGPGILVFGSALNLLLFSPTYGEAILERMANTLQNDKRYSYLFAVSTTAKGDEIAKLEDVADNLIQSHSTRHPFQLHMRVIRIKGAPFIKEEVEVPLASELLEEVKDVADHSRLVVIPQIRQI